MKMSTRGAVGKAIAQRSNTQPSARPKMVRTGVSRLTPLTNKSTAMRPLLCYRMYQPLPAEYSTRFSQYGQMNGVASSGVFAMNLILLC